MNGRFAATEGVRALFVDLDKAGFDAMRSAGLKPHVLIESAGRYGAYFLVEGVPKDEMRLYEMVLANACRGDLVATSEQRNALGRMLESNHHLAYSREALEVALSEELECWHEEERVRLNHVRLALLQGVLKKLQTTH